jgi:hypothetical protein
MPVANSKTSQRSSPILLDSKHSYMRKIDANNAETNQQKQKTKQATKPNKK